MEDEARVVVEGVLKGPGRLCEEHVVFVSVDDEGVFTSCFKPLNHSVRTFDPSCGGKRCCLVADVDVVLVLHTLLEDFELQDTNSAKVGVLCAHVRFVEELDNTFVRELLKSLVESFSFEWIFEQHFDKVFGGKARDTFVLDGLLFTDGVTNT